MNTCIISLPHKIYGNRFISLFPKIRVRFYTVRCLILENNPWSYLREMPVATDKLSCDIHPRKMIKMVRRVSRDHIIIYMYLFTCVPMGGSTGPPLSESLGIDFYSGFREKKTQGGGVQFEILKNPGIDFYSGFRKKSRYTLL